MLGLRTRSCRNQSRVYRGSPQLFVPIAAASSFIAAKAKPMMQRQGAMRPFSSPAFPGRDLRLLPFDRRPRSSCSNLALVAITPQAPRWALIAVCAVPARISRRAFLVPNASFARQRRRARAYHAMLRHLDDRDRRLALDPNAIPMTGRHGLAWGLLAAKRPRHCAKRVVTRATAPAMTPLPAWFSRCHRRDALLESRPRRDSTVATVDQ